MVYCLGKILSNYLRTLNSIILCLVFLLTICFSSFGKEPKWFVQMKRLKVASSTRTTVEESFKYKKILSSKNFAIKEKDGWSEEVEYQTSDGIIEVTYSTGNCEESKSPYGYDINKDILVSLIFYPSKPAKLTLFDVKGYEVYRVEDVVGAYIYNDSSKGFSIYVIDGKVEKAEIDLTTEQAKQLSCKSKYESH